MVISSLSGTTVEAKARRMDLYRVLRVSIYLMVASGAFALSIAEQNLSYLLTVFFFGALAYLTVDMRRMKPVRLEFAGAMALALLVYTLLPLREENGWEKHFPAAFAHFLCAFQVLLFFTAYRGSVLLTFCQCTLAVVIISGIMQSDASLLLRIILFVGLLAWTLFIHSLWRSRENFEYAPAAKGDVPFETWLNERSARGLEPSRALPDKAFWQGMGFTASLSLTCLTLGFILFFSAPRLNEGLSGLIELFVRDRQGAGGTSSDSFLKTPNSVEKGWDESVKLNDLAPIKENRTHAITLQFDPLAEELADRNGHIYLRGMSFAEYRGGQWRQVAIKDKLKGETGDSIRIVDPSAPALPRPQTEYRQSADNVTAISRYYFSVGQIVRVNARGVEVDEEGAVRLPDNNVLVQSESELWTRPPVFAHQVPLDAVSGHQDRDRYVVQKGIGPADRMDEVRQLALRITASARTAIEKARAITAYLRDSGEYSYTTTAFGETQRGGDRLHEFLLSPDPKQRRGHCGLFATAFVMLARFNDLPARLSRGFARALPGRLRDGDNRIVFLNSDSHAWGEVFFKDQGWVIFEATPDDPNPTPEAAPPDQPAVAQHLPPPPKTPQRGTVQRAWDTVLGFNVQEQRELYDQVRDAVRSGLGRAGYVLTGESNGGWLGAAIAWIVIVFLFGWLMQLFLRRGGKRGGYGAGAGVRSRAAVAFYNDLLHVLSRRGFVRRPGQTPREFAEMVLRRGGHAFAPVKLVTDIFENVRYGGAELSQDEFNNLQGALDALRDLTFAPAAPGQKT